MNESTTHMIMLVLAIIVTGLVVSFGVIMYRENKEIAMRNADKAVAAGDSIKNDEYLKYDNLVVDGAAIIRAIKLLRGHDISIQVENASGGYDAYINDTVPAFTGSEVYLDLGTKMTDDENEQQYKEAKLSTEGSGRYIYQSDKYHSRVVRSVTGAITTIVFEKE